MAGRFESHIFREQRKVLFGRMIFGLMTSNDVDADSGWASHTTVSELVGRRPSEGSSPQSDLHVEVATEKGGALMRLKEPDMASEDPDDVHFINGDDISASVSQSANDAPLMHSGTAASYGTFNFLRTGDSF